jgi:hypothetical protein
MSDPAFLTPPPNYLNQLRLSQPTTYGTRKSPAQIPKKATEEGERRLDRFSSTQPAAHRSERGKEGSARRKTV